MAHPLYNTARWRHTRERILHRDNYTCQMCGCFVIKSNRHPRSGEVDHITPHQHDPELFWCDDDGLQTLCKRCHATEKQSQERNGYSDRIGPDGLPVDPAHPFNR